MSRLVSFHDLKPHLALVILYTATLAAFAPRLGPVEVASAALLAVPLIILSVTDLKRNEIPDLATLAVAAIALGSLALAAPNAILLNLATAALILATLWCFGAWIFHRRGHEGLGIGDAKLFAALTLLLGPQQLPDLFLLASLGGILTVTLTRRITGDETQGLPFGPYIAYAGFVLTFLDPLFLAGAV